MSNFDPALLKEVPIHNLVGVRRIHPAISPAARKVYYENSILNKLADRRFFEGAKLKEKIDSNTFVLTDTRSREMTLRKLPGGKWRLDRTAFTVSAAVLPLLDGNSDEIQKLLTHQYYYREAQLGEVASILPAVDVKDGTIDVSGSTINGISVLDLPEGADWNIVLRVFTDGKSYLWDTTVDKVQGIAIIDDDMEDEPQFAANDSITFNPTNLMSYLQVQFKLGEEKVGSRFLNLKTAL